MRLSRTWPTAVIVAAIHGAPAWAQAPPNGFSAMQPSKGTFLIHEMFFYRSFDAHESTAERDLDQVTALTTLSYGVLGNLSLSLDVPVVWNRFDDSALAGDDDDFGVGDSRLLAKLRVFQHDTGPTDTMRSSLIGGLQFPGSEPTYDDASIDSWDPIVGGVFSVVRGRHGFNADATFELNTEEDDRPGEAHTLRYDASYLFRIVPKAYGEETSHLAWYAVAELNGIYDTNGDHELFISPGLMYEAMRFTIDATVMIPVVRDLDERPETEVVVGVGIRIPF